MNKRLLWLFLFLLVLGGVVWYLSQPKPLSGQVQAAFESLPTQAAEFRRITGPESLKFPRDMGAHEDTQTEWWYYTGNLISTDGRKFGYQLTFFRRALRGPGQVEPRQSAWGFSQVYLAHFTLSDAGQSQFHQFERLERGAAGLAGAMGEPQFQVWLQDWTALQIGPSTYELKAAQGDISLALTLKDRKGIILQGDRGYSQKGPQAGNASMYFSQPRLESQGTLRIGGSSYTVSGESWMDHEYGTSALGEGQVGWDWFSIQFDNGEELMVYHIRDRNGGVDDFSRGMLVKSDGTTRSFSSHDFEIQVTSTWKSPHSGGTYPASWIIRIPSEDATLQIQPLIADQELNNSFVYWEGAVRLTGTLAGRNVSGAGFVELTGYARSFEGGF